MKNVLIIGATSTIAETTARLFAKRGDRPYLMARNEERLNTMTSDLQIRGASKVDTAKLDVNDFETHNDALDKAFQTLGKVDIVLVAHGILPNQKACEQDFKTALSEINTNAISTISLLTDIANKLETQESGTIAVITSVAGDRGRQSIIFTAQLKAWFQYSCKDCVIDYTNSMLMYWISNLAL